MRFLILDRDGVINCDSDDFIKSLDEWEPLPGSMEAIADLTRAGFRIAVLTNQSGVARGLFDLATLEAMHHKMCITAAACGGHIEAVFYCPHAAEAGCRCRKPLPGLYEQFSARFAVDPHGIPAVGDSLRDLQAARAAGASPILVRTGKGLRTLAAHPDLDVPVFDDLYAVSRHLLR